MQWVSASSRNPRQVARTSSSEGSWCRRTPKIVRARLSGELFIQVLSPIPQGRRGARDVVAPEVIFHVVTQPGRPGDDPLQVLPVGASAPAPFLVDLPQAALDVRLRRIELGEAGP